MVRRLRRERQITMAERKQFSRIPPFNAAKRARAIESAIVKGEIKRNDITDDILVLLYQLIEQQEKQIA